MIFTPQSAGLGPQQLVNALYGVGFLACGAANALHDWNQALITGPFATLLPQMQGYFGDDGPYQGLQHLI